MKYSVSLRADTECTGGIHAYASVDFSGGGFNCRRHTSRLHQPGNLPGFQNRLSGSIYSSFQMGSIMGAPFCLLRCPPVGRAPPGAPFLSRQEASRRRLPGTEWTGLQYETPKAKLWHKPAAVGKYCFSFISIPRSNTKSYCRFCAWRHSWRRVSSFFWHWSRPLNCR